MRGRNRLGAAIEVMASGGTASGGAGGAVAGATDGAGGLATDGNGEVQLQVLRQGREGH
jgi:hypothetical protein